MRHLSAEELLILHARVVDATGGSHGVRDIGLLQSISVKPSAQFGGRDLYDGVFKKAAVLLESIANYHVFIDGNKRTALTAAAYFLHQNGYELTASNAAAEKMVLAVATKSMEVDALEVWLKKHSTKAV
ncbi:MAG: type II toxin-antitoxin system death-on-curing family toxin [Patescibacteria group bacterium]|nr:type II toxin-antitoxin system death-on-curing family toxin [Patescibacteria group bacterium]